MDHDVQYVLFVSLLCKRVARPNIRFLSLAIKRREFKVTNKTCKRKKWSRGNVRDSNSHFLERNLCNRFQPQNRCEEDRLLSNTFYSF